MKKCVVCATNCATKCLNVLFFETNFHVYILLSFGHAWLVTVSKAEEIFLGTIWKFSPRKGISDIQQQMI